MPYDPADHPPRCRPRGAAVDGILVLDHVRIAERGIRAGLVDRAAVRLRDVRLRERRADALVAAGDGAGGRVAPIDRPA
ncbi:hypothetical protein [Streptomyces sp. NPDC058385]|uniref:hypothetical protein n=1 Tax=Streptomyces sp. NPDC058385 TaxID=3346473 RepID=UPI003663718C